LAALDDVQREMADTLLDLAKSSGLFIAPVGELEGWMNLGSTRKNKWIVLALEALYNGQCPSELKDFIGVILDCLRGS